jgi:hypothetical protein
MHELYKILSCKIVIIGGETNAFRSNRLIFSKIIIKIKCTLVMQFSTDYFTEAYYNIELHIESMHIIWKQISIVKFNFSFKIIMHDRWNVCIYEYFSFEITDISYELLGAERFIVTSLLNKKF